MIKSQYDTNEYKTFTLDNKLRVLLVGCENSTTSGVSLAVSVGSYDETVQGTAHFLEHLLFMGSEKYPNENEYSSYVSENGGYTNAYTSSTYTNYLFQIDSTKLYKALDMFSQMFISPLLGESAVERELQAVNSEFLNYCNNDHWRSHEVTKILANPDHPFKNFNVGNAQSLNIPNIVEHVRELYQTKYSSNLMNLCIVSNLDLELLAQEVTNMFNKIPNKNYVQRKHYPQFFLDMQKTIKVVPIKNKHTMNVIWQIYSNTTDIDKYQYKPLSFLSHILGHEGKGSILAKLIDQGYATNLYAGESESNNMYGLFSIVISLTDEGIKNTDNVLDIIYSYIDLMKSQFVDYSLVKTLYDDNQNTHKLTWTFLPKSNESSSVIIAACMHDYNFLDLNKINVAPYYFADFNEDAHNLILQYLLQFVQSNSIVQLESPQYDNSMYCHSVEKWFNVFYTVHDDPSRTFDTIYPNLNTPKPNIFLPTNLELYESNDLEPILIVDTNQLKIFCKKTSQFGLPHADCKFNLNINDFYTSIKTNVLVDVLAQYIMTQLGEILYDAYLLNYQCNLIKSDGLLITLSGFDSKINQLLEILVDAITNSNINQCMFELTKEKMIKNLENEKFSDPSRLITNVMQNKIDAQSFDTKSKCNILVNLNCDDLSDFIKTLKFDNCVALFEGNLNEKLIDDLEKQILKLKYNATPNHNPIEIKLPDVGLDYLIEAISENPNEQNECILVSYYYGKLHPLINSNSYKLLALFNIVNYFVSEPFFDELRTKQQLGYTVASYSSNSVGRTTEKLYMQNFLIQSPNTSCDQLLKAIDEFIKERVVMMQSLDDNSLQNFIDATRTELTKPYNNLGEITAVDFLAIKNLHLNFKLRTCIVQELEKITKNDVMSFFFEHYQENVKRYVTTLTKNKSV